jgi:hypothetical protein
MPVTNIAIHPASAAADHTPAIRKNGLKAIVQIASGLLFTFSTAGMAMSISRRSGDHTSFSEAGVWTAGNGTGDTAA